MTTRASTEEHKLQARQLLEFLRGTVVEAFSGEYFPEMADVRNSMINALNGMQEKCVPSGDEKIHIDADDIHVFVSNRQTILDAADKLQREYGKEGLAAGLRNVVRSIEALQSNLWQPLPHDPSHDLDLDERPEFQPHTAASL